MTSAHRHPGSYLTFRQVILIIFCFTFLFTLALGFVVDGRFYLKPFASTKATQTAVVERFGKPYSSYSYQVGGSVYEGAEPGSNSQGDQIKVFYLLSDPSVSTTSDPTSGFRGLFTKAILTATGFAVATSIMMYGFAWFMYHAGLIEPVSRDNFG